MLVVKGLAHHWSICFAPPPLMHRIRQDVVQRLTIDLVVMQICVAVASQIVPFTFPNIFICGSLPQGTNLRSARTIDLVFLDRKSRHSNRSMMLATSRGLCLRPAVRSRFVHRRSAHAGRQIKCQQWQASAKPALLQTRPCRIQPIKMHPTTMRITWTLKLRCAMTSRGPCETIGTLYVDVWSVKRAEAETRRNSKEFTNS